MSKVFFKLANGNFFQNWSNTGLITTNNDWSAVDSIMGYRGDGLTGGSGRDPRLVATDGTQVVNVNANQGAPNTFSAGGVTEFQLADPVVALQGSGTAQAPNLVLFLDASGRQNLHFSVDLRDIDGSADNAVQQVAVQYRIGDSGSWTALPAGYVADASTGPGAASAVTHLDFDLPAALDNQSQVEIRILTTDAAGSDEWIGIDNISVTSAAMGADTAPPVLSSSTPADGAIGVAGDANLVLNFNELVALGSGNLTISDGNGDTRVIAVNDASQVSLSGQALTINPSVDLNPGTTYHVSIDAGAVLDLAGNAYGGSGADQLDFTVMPGLIHTYDIQGAGHSSPLAGSFVNTRGVVTAIDTSGTKGFWIQDPDGDADDATSDGLFVVSSATASVKVGDLVSLQGTVVEFQGSNVNNLTITQLNSVQNIKVLSSGNVIAPTVVGEGGHLVPTEVVDSDQFAVFNPQTDAIDFYESLEGMLLTARNVQVVGNTVSGATFVITDNGAHATGVNDRGAITRGAGDANPERFEIYGDTGINAGATGVYSAGDQLGDVTGVLSYYGGNYELLPTVTPAAAVHAVIGRDTTALAGDDSHLTVAAYNVENLDPNDSAAKFAALGRDIAVNLGSPDVLGLEEIQDNNGTGTGELSSDLTLGKLIDAIAAAGGPRYAYVVLDPEAENSNGGEPNGNIRNAILYNPDRVSYVDESARMLDDADLANGDAYANSRHPLVADFVFRGETVTYVGIHNYSRIGSDELFGRDQPAINAGDARRIDQTTPVRDFVHQLEQVNGDANIVVAGDFNGYHFETSLTQLEQNGDLVNMVWSLPASDRYSSTYEGNNEQIDQLLVSANLAPQAQFDNVHLNTNLPTGVAPTDHDPVLARLFINHAPQAAGDSPNMATEDTVLAIDAMQGVLANDTDVNHDHLSAELLAAPEHGTLALADDGSFVYTPDANYNGGDSFSYVAHDPYGGVSGVATVQLTIAAVDDAPLLTAGAPDAQLVEQGAAGDGVDSAVVQLVRSDIDSATSYDTSDWTYEGEGLYSRAGQYGIAMLDTVHDTVRYTLDNTLPATNGLADGAAVSEQFTVTITDGATSVSTPLSFDIKGANDTPYGRGERASVAEDASVTINVLGNDGDPDGDSLTIVLADAHSQLGATLVVEDGKVRYVADADSFDLLAAGQSAADRFVYSVSDGHGGSSGPIAVTLTVAEAGDSQSLAGGNKADTFVDTAGHDTTYAGGNGDDNISGADGADVLSGDNGSDWLDGGAGIDRLTGGNGDDKLLGGAGSDTLSGDNGVDLLWGGAGDDALSGGNGGDRFVFSANGGRDTISDFRPGEDHLLVGYAGNGSAADLSAWVAGSHSASGFVLSNADTDGNGSMDAVLITGAPLGDGSIVLLGWTLATLSPGGWIA